MIHMFERWLPGIFLGFAFAALVVIVLASTGPDRSPITWLEYSSIDGVHCPGDKIPYRVVLQIDRPGPVYATSSILRADDHPDVVRFRTDPWVAEWSRQTGLQVSGDTISGQMMGDVFITVIPKGGVLFVDDDFSFTVPDLPPGPYVRNVAAGMWGTDSTATVRSQRFSIGADCER